MAAHRGRDGTREVQARRTRREVLASGVAGAMGVIAVEAIRNPTPAHAGVDGDVVLGVDNSATSLTAIITGSSGADVFAAQINSGAGTALRGSADRGTGVLATSNYGPALSGSSQYAEGIYAQSGAFYGTNRGATRTGVHGVTDSSSDSAMWGENGGGGNGVYGSTYSSGASGVYGHNAGTGYGVAGRAESGTGTLGDSTDGTGVSGSSANGTGVAGSCTNNGTGVLGFSGSGIGLHGHSVVGEGLYAQSGNAVSASQGSRIGVHGVTDGTDPAVRGENLGAPGGDGIHGSTSTSGSSGVYGENASTGYGIAGRCDRGTGASGYSANGVGVVAASPKGTALSVTGKAKFNRSGIVSISSPATTATVTVPGGLSAAALVLALMQNSVSGVWVANAVPNTSTGKVTINLNQAPSSSAKVAWFVLN